MHQILLELLHFSIAPQEMFGLCKFDFFSYKMNLLNALGNQLSKYLTSYLQQQRLTDLKLHISFGHLSLPDDLMNSALILRPFVGNTICTVAHYFFLNFYTKTLEESCYND